jgi:signal transduction histidine kinase
MVAGLNPHRTLDQSYRGFIELLTGQIAAAVARADEHERERSRAEALAEIDRAKTAFFSNVSHEFRAPLTLMLGPLEDALSDLTNVPIVQAERIKVAHRNGARLLRLVNALLDFSRIEAGRTKANFEPIDMGGADYRACVDLSVGLRTRGFIPRSGLRDLGGGSLRRPRDVGKDCP